MGIMDSFYILFEADAKSLNKGLDESDKKTEDLTKKLSTADKMAGTVGNSFKDLIVTAGGAMLAIASFSAIQSSIASTIEYGARLGDLNNILDISVEDLDAWGKAVQLNGGVTEEFFGTLNTMSADLAMISTKGTSRMLPFWKELGIQLKDVHGNMRPVMELLPELADKFEKMSKQESLGMGKKLGLDQGTIAMLQQGRRYVEDQINQMKEMGVLTKDQTDALGELDDAIDKGKFHMQSWGATILTKIMPTIKQMMELWDQFSGFMSQHKNLVNGALIAISGVLTGFLVKALRAVKVEAILAFLPFLLMASAIGAVIAIFALLYEDIQAFRAGNASLIGDIMRDYPWIADLVSGIADAFSTLWDVAKEVMGLLGDVFSLAINKASELWNQFIEGNSWIQKLIDLADILGGAFGAAFDIILKAFQNTFGEVMSGIDDMIDTVKDIGKTMGIDLSLEGVKNARTVVQAANANPLNATNSATIANSRVATNNVTVGKVEVHTKATDSDGIAKAVGADLHAHIKKGAAQYDDGIRI